MTNSYGPSIVRDGLVLCLDAADRLSYPRSGSTWYDLSGNGNHGTFGASTAAPTFSSANVGCLNFDGSDDYINCGKVLNGPNQVSVEVSVKNPNGGVLVTKGYTVFEYRVGLTEFYGYNGSNGGWWPWGDVYSDTHNVDITTWNTFTYVCDYVNNYIKLYANGIFKHQRTNAGLDSNYPTYDYDLLIGKRVENSSGYLSAQISHVRVYDKVLSASEVQQNYEATKGRFFL